MEIPQESVDPHATGCPDSTPPSQSVSLVIRGGYTDGKARNRECLGVVHCKANVAQRLPRIGQSAVTQFGLLDGCSWPGWAKAEFKLAAVNQSSKAGRREKL